MEVFRLNPIDHCYSLEDSPLYQGPVFQAWPSMNVVQDHGRIRKRCGYSLDRTTVSGVDVHGVYVYQQRDGTRRTIILSEEDVMVRETASGKTFTYYTPRYTTGTITSIVGTTVTGSGTAWNTDNNVQAGDYFIMDDDHTTDVEPDSNWVKVASVTDDTHLELESSYTKNGTTYKIRQIYRDLPTGGRWSVAVCDNTFCFSHGGVNVQKIGAGETVASDLDATNAVKARYLLTYANRLWLADLEISGQREPWSVQWSAEGDVTDWTGSTAGSADFLDSQDILTGLGKVGNKIVVYKKDSFHIGHRTGIATAPVVFPTHRRGAGLWAPYSLVHTEGTNAWVGREDVYILEGDIPKSVGAPIRDRLFEIVPQGALVDIWGVWDGGRNRVIWFAYTSTLGQVGFTWDYKEDAWTTFKFYHEMTGAGMGGI